MDVKNLALSRANQYKAPGAATIVQFKRSPQAVANDVHRITGDASKLKADSQSDQPWVAKQLWATLGISVGVLLLFVALVKTGYVKL